MDCGPTSLRMIANHFGRQFSLQTVRSLCDKGQQGVTLFGIHKAAEQLGFRSKPIKINWQLFKNEAVLPCIVHWNNDHYIVVYKISRNKVYVADPGVGKLVLSFAEFKNGWMQDNDAGKALFFEPTQSFYNHKDDEQGKSGTQRLFGYVRQYKSYLNQLGIAAVVAAVINLFFPFLTQALVDQGIGNQELSFVYVILIAQIVLFFSRTATDFIRGWLVVHMGTRINVAVVSDFLIKLMRLPLGYFNSKNLGDTLTRIADQRKIEEFLTAHSVNVIFSILNLIIFSFILAIYSWLIFFIFVIGSSLGIFWLTLFLNKRRVLDYQYFTQSTTNQNAIVQIVQGMPEIKLNQCENRQRWRWEVIQAKLFKLRIKVLALEQYQQAGVIFTNEGKNILITFVAANQVINGEITLGMMMAITYILGQVNAPIEQLLDFIHKAQDAKISMERLGEIQDMPNENHIEAGELCTQKLAGDIVISSAAFKYSSYDNNNVINGIDLIIPENKVTAIVGSSGGGKTTLMKVLLRFFPLTEGNITVGGRNLKYSNVDTWRENCGAVLQDGYLFSNSVVENITMGKEIVDWEQVIRAAKTANIHTDIEMLPQGYYTKIGREGHGLSGGQTQRILIARAVYKSPDYLFFDEATSALDSSNEKVIQDNLQNFFKNRTVVIIAHRLSTVKQADQIVVLHQGKIAEVGTHKELTMQKGRYFDLVKNQLELGS